MCTLPLTYKWLGFMLKCDEKDLRKKSDDLLIHHISTMTNTKIPILGCVHDKLFLYHMKRGVVMDEARLVAEIETMLLKKMEEEAKATDDEDGLSSGARGWTLDRRLAYPVQTRHMFMVGATG